MLPADIKNLGRSIVAAATFTSNFWFYDIAIDYFATESLSYQPMLHTWSLGIEAQFYLIFPVILYLAYRYGRQHIRLVLGALIILSAGYSLYVIGGDPQAGFFKFLPRAWELLLGGLIYFLPPLQRGSRLLAAASLAALLFAAFYYTPDMGFPGIYAFLPVGATALILSARPGMSEPYGITQKILAAPLVKTAANISYSLYLWHWPLFALARYQTSDALPLWLSGVLISLSVFLAFLSWRCIEQPFLKKKGMSVSVRRRMAAPLGLLIAALVCGILVKNVVSAHALSYLPEGVKQYAAAEKDLVKGDCDLTEEDGFPCRFGVTEAPPSIFLWGNSYARMWSPGLDAMAKEHEASGISAIQSACLPLMTADADDSCRAFNEDVMSFLRQSDIKTIILAGNWFLTEDFGPALTERIKELQAMDKKIVVMLRPPYPDFHVPRTLALAALRGSDIPTFIPLDTYERYQQPFREVVSPLQNLGVKMIEPGKTICTAQGCPLVHDGVVLYYDGAHLTRSAAILYKDIFAPVFE